MTGADASMLSNTCAGCHGTDGGSSGPAIPSIGGMSATYITDMMNAYKSGDTVSTIMGRIAKGYSEDEIGAMANYFAEQSQTRADQSFDKAKAAKGMKLHDKYCEKCHSEGGSLADDDSGILAGQLTPYLHYSMEDFDNGDRSMPEKMKKKVKKLNKKEGAAGMEAILNYYASQR
ncbi:MAG: c-type cytochrome [Gammaproteobacteria bacterium]|uniref:C-type cytochrome n=1 Tax=Candidatus Thiopontia autotrophica TaxID=2841688 RepID=A0A8J6PAC9_9GAMM|nr:c-type cytochrome [Candidatus Thiopontia autotrophica]MBL6968682.1 c-type cytochrome [Gammaproteobacteria bacterium]